MNNKHLQYRHAAHSITDRDGNVIAMTMSYDAAYAIAKAMFGAYTDDIVNIRLTIPADAWMLQDRIAVCS